MRLASKYFRRSDKENRGNLSCLEMREIRENVTKARSSHNDNFSEIVSSGGKHKIKMILFIVGSKARVESSNISVSTKVKKNQRKRS